MSQLIIPIKVEALTVKPDPQKTSNPQAVDVALVSHADSERVNNTHRAYKEMRQRILDGAMPAGAQFLEQELAEMLGMSRTPVREALIRLQDERLVEVKPRHGARVLAVSAEELADIYEISSDLEASAVRRVALAGLQPASLQRLEAAIARMEAATAAKDFPEWLSWDHDFHAGLVEAAANQRLLDIFNGLMAQVYRARHTTLAGRGVPPLSNKEHRSIVDALIRRDADVAHKLMYEHRMRSRTNLVGYLKGGQR